MTLNNHFYINVKPQNTLYSNKNNIKVPTNNNAFLQYK